MKRFLAWLLILVMCISFVACGQQDAPDTQTQPTKETTQVSDPTTEGASGSATPLLYKVTDQGGNVLWLFGSIHVGREDYYPLPDYVMDAYESADSLAVEFDVIAFEKDTQAMMELANLMIYTDGTTIKDHIPEDLYSRATKALKGLDAYAFGMDMMLPAMWSSEIDSALVGELGGNTDLGIDMHFLEKAKKDGKEILEVESAQFQFGMLTGFSEEVQIMLLEASVEMYEDQTAAKEDLDKLMGLWAAGDEVGFAEYLAISYEDMTDEERALYEEYEYAMTTSRNLSMTDYAENVLKSGKEVFLCVGAAHIVGEGAMAQLLAQRGYTVECITN